LGEQHLHQQHQQQHQQHQQHHWTQVEAAEPTEPEAQERPARHPSATPSKAHLLRNPLLGGGHRNTLQEMLKGRFLYFRFRFRFCVRLDT
jgi:hypothetical protein